MPDFIVAENLHKTFYTIAPGERLPVLSVHENLTEAEMKDALKQGEQVIEKEEYDAWISELARVAAVDAERERIERERPFRGTLYANVDGQFIRYHGMSEAEITAMLEGQGKTCQFVTEQEYKAATGHE